MGPALSLWSGTPAGAQTMVGTSVVKGGALPLNSEAGGIWEAQVFPMQACLALSSCSQEAGVLSTFVKPHPEAPKNHQS